MEVEIEGDFGAVHACLRKENERGHVREHGGHVREPRARPRRTGTKRTGSRTCPLGPADREVAMVSISRQQCKRGRQRKDVEVLTRLGPLQAKGRRIYIQLPCGPAPPPCQGRDTQASGTAHKKGAGAPSHPTFMGRVPTQLCPKP